MTDEFKYMSAFQWKGKHLNKYHLLIINLKKAIYIAGRLII